MNSEQLAKKIIKQLTEAGVTPDEMLKVIKLVRLKYKQMKKVKNEARKD